jgi:hypothetical protein
LCALCAWPGWYHGKHVPLQADMFVSTCFSHCCTDCAVLVKCSTPLCATSMFVCQVPLLSDRLAGVPWPAEQYAPMLMDVLMACALLNTTCAAGARDQQEPLPTPAFPDIEDLWGPSAETPIPWLGCLTAAVPQPYR